MFRKTTRKEALISKIYILIILCLAGVQVWGQTRPKEELEKEKKENLNKINEAKKELLQTQKKKNSTLGKVKSLNHEIGLKEKQLQEFGNDLSLIESEIKELENANIELERKLASLKKEYGEMLYLASKASGQLNQLCFLFSAKTFNELLMRYKYLEQYTDNRKTQVKQINAISEMLLNRRIELREKRTEQQKAFNAKKAETMKLEGLKSQQSEIVADLAGQEAELRTEIAERSKSVKRLNNLISAVVSKEMARTKATPNTKKTSTKNTVTAENKPAEEIKELPVATNALSSDFAKNKSRLPWPVNNGFISDQFGVKPHPVIKGVKIDNHGIDIQTNANAVVKSVFEGTVLDISQIPGLNNVVAVNHGDYYTIYANLASVNVSLNQKVNAGQSLGNAAIKDGEYEINFQIWKQFDKLNPALWLKAR